MKLFFKKLAILIVIVIAINYVSSAVMDTYCKKHEFYTGSKMEWVTDMDGGHYDYAVLGSSRVLHMVNVKLMDGRLGKKGINIGTPGSSYAENYLMLKLFLERNKIKTLILNADEFCFNSSISYSYPFKDYELLPYFLEPENFGVFRDNIPTSRFLQWVVLPLNRYFEFNDRFEIHPSDKRMADYDSTAGSQLLYDLEYKAFEGYTRTQFVLDDNDIKYFHKIMSLCDDHGIRKILVTTPIFPQAKEYFIGRDTSYRYIRQTADSLNIPYIHYDDLGPLNDKALFRDFTHMNSDGANVYSKLLADKVKGLL